MFFAFHAISSEPLRRPPAPLLRNSDRPWRRRNYFIDKEFQTRFILKFLSVVMAGSALSGYVMYLMINRQVEDRFYSGHISLSNTGQLLLPTLLKVNLGVIIFVLLLIAVLTLFISHKVAGPLLRLGKNTEKIAEGDLTADYRLRSNDELKNLAGSFEQMNEGLKERFDELRRHAEEIDRTAESLLALYSHPALPGKPGPGKREKLEELSDNAAAFGRKLAGFELKK